VKRVFDFLLALIASPFALVLVMLTALAIRMDSPGPAIFRQRRVGRQERLFTLYKLRTMQIAIEDVPSHMAAPAMVTRVGRFMRKTKLDELPQLFNVLLGDMAFIGPRPCLPSQIELIEARRALGVYAARPGISGLAQVHGVDMSEPQRLAAIDADYVRTASLLSDVRLIVATLAGKGSGDAVR